MKSVNDRDKNKDTFYQEQQKSLVFISNVTPVFPLCPSSYENTSSIGEANKSVNANPRKKWQTTSSYFCTLQVRNNN